MRLIESNKVIPLVRMMLMNHPKADAICENMQKLVDIHTIEVEAVKHGRWVDKMVRDWHCSECGKKVPRQVYFDGYCYNDKLNYCPNCGAKMCGGAENER